MINNILIVGPSWVGDMVMAQCLFKLLKRRNPDVVIDVLAPAWSFSLLRVMPEIRNGIIMPMAHGELRLKERYKIGKQLRANKYDQAIVLPNSFKSALIPFFAKIPIRTGWSREGRLLILNDVRRLDKKRYPLMIEQYLALGLPENEQLQKPYPLPELKVTPEFQKQTFDKFKIDLSKPTLALCPGAEFGPAKRWPEDHFAEVASKKLADGWNVLLLGSQKDRVVTDQIDKITDNRCINLSGTTNLDEAIALLSGSKMVISNDSGLMHIAAALDRKLIALYGPTSDLFTPPLNKDAKVIKLNLDCQPCFQRECPLVHHKCMKELAPALVLSQLGED